MKKLVLLLSYLTLGVSATIAQNSDRSKLLWKVDSLLQSSYNPTQPGVALAIVENGQTIYTNTMGMANMEDGVSITDSSAFHIASVSKQFAAYLALALEKEGKLSMNDDLKKYLPELNKLPYKIRLRQLANHTHGLPNLFELAKLKGIDIGDNFPHKSVIEMLLRIKQLNFVPGEKYQYNNTGFALLAEIIERIENMPFQEVLEKRILKPVGMKNTVAVGNSAFIVKNKVQSYRLSDGKLENYDFRINAIGSSGISTTINDLSKWAINFQSPSADARNILQEMSTPSRLNSGEVLPYGLGLETKTYKGLKLVFHGGGDASYRSYILHVPAHSFSVVILGNGDDFTPLEIVYKVVDLFLGEYETVAAPKKIIYTAQELKKYEGTYEMFPGTFYNIVAKKDSLFFQSYGDDDMYPLPVIGDGDFLFPYIPASKFSFYKNGFKFHIADFSYTCTKVTINPPATGSINLSEFAGIYKNEMLNTFYELIIKEDKLVAVHSFNDEIVLEAFTKDRFYSNQSYFGKLEFIRNENKKVIKFNLSGQNLKGLEFIKVN